MNYTIQCTDQDSGQVGCFGYEPMDGNIAGSFHALTPVFPSLAEFYRWAKSQGIELNHGYTPRGTQYAEVAK